MDAARRGFVMLALAMVAIPHAIYAQHGKVRRVGVISSTASLAELPHHPYVTVFVERLREFGWNEGDNVVIERRTSEGRSERFGPIVTDLVSLDVDVIVLVSNAGALAARKVTATTPIVMVTSGAPDEIGLAASLARPGGNVTGQTSIAEPKEEGKRLELLKQAVPRAKRVAYLAPQAFWDADYGRHAREAARALGLTLTFLPAAARGEFISAFEAMRRDRPDAMYLLGSAESFAMRQLIVDFAAEQRLPAMSAFRATTEGGGLISYGASLTELWLGAARYVDKILRGAKPGDLPIERPSRFELVINLKTAKALGLTIPPSLLIRADHVIE